MYYINVTGSAKTDNIVKNVH